MAYLLHDTAEQHQVAYDLKMTTILTTLEETAPLRLPQPIIIARETLRL